MNNKYKTCGSILLGALLVVSARGEPADASVASRLPPAPIVSHDGALRIGAAVETVDYRLPVLTFVGQVRTELMRTTGLQCGSRTRPISIYLGPGQGGSTAVLSRARDASGIMREHVTVADPETVDLDEFRFVLVRAFIRAWLAAATDDTHTLPAEPPLWLMRGLARRQNRELRLLDFERTYRLWSRGRLPLLHTLLAANSLAEREPAVASVLTGFISGDGAPEKRFRALLTPVATDGGWQVERVLATLALSGDAADCERTWDSSMLAGCQMVIIPGVTPPGVLRRFGNQLRLFPVDVAAAVADGWRGLGPDELLVLANQPWVCQLARRKEHQLAATAIGRDETFKQIVEAYAAFFGALGGQDHQEQAAVLLQTAHEHLRDATQQAVAGKILCQ